MSWLRVSALEAAELLRTRGYVYLDVRSVEEFALGHPEGAFNVPWQERGALSPNPLFVRVVSAAFARERGIVVGCQMGQRSGPATAALEAAGFVNAVELRAGFGGRRDAFGKLIEPGWERAGLPVAVRPQAGRSYLELCDGAAGSGES